MSEEFNKKIKEFDKLIIREIGEQDEPPSLKYFLDLWLLYNKHKPVVTNNSDLLTLQLYQYFVGNMEGIVEEVTKTYDINFSEILDKYQKTGWIICQKN